MKKTILLSTLLASSYTAFAEPVTNPDLPKSMMSQVIQPNVVKAQAAIETLKNTLQKTEKGKRSEAIDTAFTTVVSTWKAVQAGYIAGELNPDMIDTPQLIDTYHYGKETLSVKLEGIIKRNDVAKDALFKNSYKSINALSFYLFADDDLSETERLYAIHTTEAIEKHLISIAEAYQQHQKDFQADADISMSYLLNALIESSYKLKEWRIGDPAGLSRKFKGEPDSSYQEYPYSKKSWDAIIAIVDVHDAMMGERDFTNLGSAAIEQEATEEVANIRKLITTAQQQAKTLKANNTAFTEIAKIKPLFNTLNKLNDAYYQSLIKALPVQAKILDADGD